MLVIGYPKSGNTWLCYLLAYCLNAEYDDHDEPGVHPRDPYQRQYVKGGLGHPSFGSSIGKILKTHFIDPANISGPFVYIMRDGRDVMVSYYFFRKYFLKEDIGEFNEFFQTYARQWTNHIKKYTNREEVIPVKYEDLSQRPQDAIGEIFSRLETPVDAAVIQDALEIFKFEQLSQRERGVEERSSFFRKGIVGDWKNHFSIQDQQKFNEIAGETLDAIGYPK